jgi:8-oxo-dGTP diphosphatase
MQMVVNCVIRKGDRLLMLKKPRRGWWVAPGGKVEEGESLAEAVVREVFEETGVTIESPQLRGVFTILLREGGELVGHWMLYTFYAQTDQDFAAAEVEEGELGWVPIDEIASRPMAEGDRYFLQSIVEAPERLITGKFTYTPDYQLLDWQPE